MSIFPSCLFRQVFHSLCYVEVMLKVEGGLGWILYSFYEMTHYLLHDLTLKEAM